MIELEVGDRLRAIRSAYMNTTHHQCNFIEGKFYEVISVYPENETFAVNDEDGHRVDFTFRYLDQNNKHLFLFDVIKAQRIKKIKSLEL